VDTQSHQKYFKDEFGATNVESIYVGCNKKLFRPLGNPDKGDKYTVLWYGSANPLQGVDVILRAAKLLKDQDVIFKIIGPVRKKHLNLINELMLPNVEFIDYVPYERLPEVINQSDLCLGGHFSDKNKALRVIPCKTYQFLECGKPTIVADNPANKELFCEGSLVHFVRPNCSAALAEKIMEIYKSGK
jgi:glycosyltransferase involved in cell wall biosynthesis